jgi:hypothetical protein
LNGKPSTVGYYAYETPPPDGLPFGGDVNQKFVSFDAGVLMDGTGTNPGKSVGFPHESVPQIRTIFFELGQIVTLESIRVHSKLAGWWGFNSFEVSFSRQGDSYDDTMRIEVENIEKPHAEGLDKEKVVTLSGIQARFLRFRFDVPPWNHVQIGEIDINAATLPGEEPVSRLDIHDFQEVVRQQTETPAVDQFGQWTRDDWPGKIKSEKELVKQILAEEERYQDVNLNLEKFDRFGGDKTLGIQSQATGKFRLEKKDGRWWFITPDGYPFLMIAVDAVTCHDPTDMNTVEYPGKPELSRQFTWLPPKDGEFSDCWWSPPVGWWGTDRGNVWRFNYYRANLVRVFGKQYHVQRFENLAQRRLIDWGFNSRGKWNEKDNSDRPLPYILVAGIHIGEGVDFTSYGNLADPWDPYYPTAVENQVKQFVRQHGTDPYFIGFTIGNEEWWDDNITKTVLKSNPPTPAKKEFIRRLQIRYMNIADVNQKCQTDWKSYDELFTVDLSGYLETLQNEISAFIELSSAQLYRTWREAVDQYDPGRLILGSSFVLWWLCSPEWVRGSIPYCDAIMLDDYPLEADGILKGYVEAFAVPADKPVLLGEYSFTTSQRGYKPFRCNVASQRERGLHYRKFNEALYAHPNWVGSMWFIYPDLVLLGRNVDGSGESHNFGLVDICNLPYYDMIEIMKETNKRLYAIHAGK